MNKNISLKSLSKGEILSKLPKSITTTHLVLMVISVILAALTIYFAVAYFSAVSNKKDMNQQITQKQQQINNMGGLQNIAALQSQLEQVQADVVAKSPFPEVIDNTDVAYTIIQAAREASISCFQYSPLSVSSTNINDRSYVANRYSISVQGTTDTTGEKINRITNFLEVLEEDYDTSYMDQVSLSDGDGDGEWTIGFIYIISSLEAPQQ